MLVPLYGFVEGDTMGLLVLAHDSMRMSQIAEKLRESASVRVRAAGPWELVAAGRVLSPERTLSESGLEALDRIDLRRRR